MGKYENLMEPNSIRTNSGIYIDPLNPVPEKILIEDVAHALAAIPRFGGHLNKPYSVAQHCCMVCDMLDDDLALEGLLHDASEAYLLDIPSPVKKRIPGYKEAEDRLSSIIAMKYGVGFPFHQKVKEADERALLDEWIGLALYNRIESWSWIKAKYEFLERFSKYGKH
jgi:hypothetical protein